MKKKLAVPNNAMPANPANNKTGVKIIMIGFLLAQTKTIPSTNKIKKMPLKHKAQILNANAIVSP